MAVTTEPRRVAPNETPTRRVLIVGADRTTFGLLDEWLSADGWQAVEDAEAGEGPFALALIDVAYPRHGGVELLRRVSTAHPGTPLLALSPTFFGSVPCTGDCARALGVDGVLPKPVPREVLLTTVRSLARG